MGAHVLAPPAVLPPPSNTEVEVPEADIPVPGAPLAIEFVPNTSPPLKEVPEQGALLFVAAEPSGDMPTLGRVIAADPRPAGPRDVPVCGSAGADPMPRGEVGLTDAGTIVPTWAEAQPQATNSAATVPSSRRVKLVFTSPWQQDPLRLSVPGCRMS